MSFTAVWVMLVCILQTSQVLCRGNACREHLILGGKYRVEDEQFTASSSFSEDYLPHEARLGGNSWCAESSDTENWIQVDFGTDVIIQELLIGGDGGAAQFYVNLFRIEYGPNSDQLSSILQPNSNQPKVFSRPDSPDVRTTVLSTPLTTRVLRIVSVVHTGSGPCLDMEAIGCPNTTKTISTTPPQQTEDAMTTTMPVSAGNTGAIVGGAMGGATFVFVILNVTFIILVVCLLVKRRNIRTEATAGSSTVQIAENETNSEETRDPNTLENMSEVYTEPTAIAYEPIIITTLNPPTTYESITIPDLEYVQVDAMNSGYSNAEERDDDTTYDDTYGNLVENGATSLSETEDGYESMWL
ncbi:uncharacterized protein LOC135351902 [Halichondria panicea]|uniref:uncharacterized protein LOC135351902 n=1 Tax=Halichondria panicea TaxID=6063 RepID=UPI00312B33D6